MIKRIFSLVLCFVCLMSLVSCSDGVYKEDSDKINILCTVFPQYDVVRRIIEGSEAVTCSLLLDKPTDPHSYQPMASDILAVIESDALIYTGGDSDKWIGDILALHPKEASAVCSLLDNLPENELRCAGHEEDRGAHEEDHGSHEHDHSPDEHIWLSPLKAMTLCDIILGVIISLDGENRDIYEKNAGKLKESLSQIHMEYESVISQGKRDILLFADRFPFLYLTEDYSLHYKAAFIGCSAESEVSADTVISLIETADETSVPVILITETGKDDLAVTVRENSRDKNQKILVINSIQAVKDPENSSYEEILLDNLRVLETALY